MVVVWTVLAALVIFGIAAVIVGREARRLAGQPPRPVFDLDEAVQWVAEHLPFEVSAELSYDDVRRILDWHIEFLRSRAVSSNGHDPNVDAPIVVGGAETVDYVLQRARALDRDYTPVQVHAVLEAQMSYLEAIGAVGPEGPGDASPPNK
jgi:hypothetical protein